MRSIEEYQELSQRYEFLITQEAGDTLSGITMEEAGVSRIVSINLTRREEETPMLVAKSALVG